MGWQWRVVLVAATVMLTGCATSADLVALDRPVSKVYEVSADKVQIFDGSRQWIAENFRSAKAVVEYEDKAAGTLIGNGVIAYACDDAGWLCTTSRQVLKLVFTMRLDSKDGRFRLEFTNLRVKSEYGEQPQMRREDLPAAHRELLALGDQIVARLQAGPGAASW